MLTKTIKWSAIAALVGCLLSQFPDLKVVLRFVITAAALVVVTQAASMRRYVWTTLFLIIACLYNPVLPIAFSRYTADLSASFAMLLFFFSLELLQPKPRLSIASITDSMPGSESL